MAQKRKLLLVDDDHHLAESMADWLETQQFAVAVAHGLRSARQLLQEYSFDLMITDLRLEDGDGLDLVRESQRRWEAMAVLVLTGYATPDTAVEAVSAGAYDVLTKPLIDDELMMAIDRALDQRTILEENDRLRRQLDSRYGLEHILSHDYRMLRIFDVVDSIADARASILITGENGTGKSMIARAIHERSSRRDGPFVEVACGALPDNLLESELFGHVAGAFTGATANRIGKFKLADGGTLFLDEIGTATPAMQVKLLRVLQELQFEPLGGTVTESVDTRVILATNEDLARAVNEQRFRQDLFYRVNVVNIQLPSLRERASDIPVLADHFLQRACEHNGLPPRQFTREALDAMLRYTWPGNVRELENVVQRAVLLSRSAELTLDDLPTEIVTGESRIAISPQSCSTPSGTWGGARSSGTSHSAAVAGAAAAHHELTLREALEEPERQIILGALRRHSGNRAATADSLGINRTTLYKKMKRLGLEDPRLLYAGT